MKFLSKNTCFVTMNHLIPISRWQSLFLRNLVSSLKSQQCLYITDSKSSLSPQLKELCGLVSTEIGGLDDLEIKLNSFKASLTSSLVTQVIESCKKEAPTRRLLRFFLWSNNTLKTNLEAKEYNRVIRLFAEKKDHTALQILISNLENEGRAMEVRTYSSVAYALVHLGRENEALKMFKNLEKYKCQQNKSTVASIIRALCAYGHAEMAEKFAMLHKEKLSGWDSWLCRSLVYAWSKQENVREVRRVINDMKSFGVMPDLFCFNTLLRCLCEANLKRNPSGLAPKALDVMMEMRSFNIMPNLNSYNVLLSCLYRARRVRDCCQILERMKTTGCSPDLTSYFLVIRLLYLTMRFGNGNSLLEEMIGKGLKPTCNFFHALIRVLCGVERPYYALELFQLMKQRELGGYGPVYDVLIRNLCYGGDFEKGKELWDEAVNFGVKLRCSSDVLDPSITCVYKPNRTEEKEGLSRSDFASAKGSAYDSDTKKGVSLTSPKDEKKKKKKMIYGDKNLKKPFKKKMIGGDENLKKPFKKKTSNINNNNKKKRR